MEANWRQPKKRWWWVVPHRQVVPAWQYNAFALSASDAPTAQTEGQEEAAAHELLPPVLPSTTQPEPAGGAVIPETNRPTWSLEELHASGKVDAQGRLVGSAFKGRTDLPPQHLFSRRSDESPLVIMLSTDKERRTVVSPVAPATPANIVRPGGLDVQFAGESGFGDGLRESGSTLL